MVRGGCEMDSMKARPVRHAGYLNQETAVDNASTVTVFLTVVLVSVTF